MYEFTLNVSTLHQTVYSRYLTIKKNKFKTNSLLRSNGYGKGKIMCW